MAIRFDNRVAIVTGAGGGLGRAHALALAARGAKVVVNDFGGALDGTGGAATPAQKVVAEIEAAGGEAIANAASVTDFAAVEAMVAEAWAKWGRVDILVCNAGILRDKTFAKMELDDFRAVIEVHLMGSVNCCKAVWEIMRQQNYGRIVLTSSSSGLFGNFGQANYAAAKMGLVGLMNALGLEGAKYNVHVNCLAPTANTRMTDTLMPAEVLAVMKPEAVSPAVLAMAHDGAPNRAIINAGANGFERTFVAMTRGVHIPLSADSPDQVVARWDEISDRKDDLLPQNAGGQGGQELAKAGVNRTTRG
ncbi:MAG TPA: SDR family NAD(P)-dependent oxidoreductase [Stellaceae bacterium]|nr:SDR family NAD(P)-dependent oxidoreductase [Stellaceae bacterium]